MADAIFISSKRLILNNIHIISFFSSLLFNFSTPPQNWSVLLYEFNFVNTFSVYRSQFVAINLPPIIVKFPLNDIENILSDCHQMQPYNPNYTFCLFFFCKLWQVVIPLSDPDDDSVMDFAYAMQTMMHDDAWRKKDLPICYRTIPKPTDHWRDGGEMTQHNFGQIRVLR